ncbi:MAG: OmpH family outer membrane protein, partial [Waddliaceae bacterium]
MKRIIFYCAVILLITGGTSFSDSLKVGFVEAQKVLENSQEGKQVQEKMEAFVQSRQTIIDLEEKELRELEEELNRQVSLLSPEAKRVKQEEFQ